MTASDVVLVLLFTLNIFYTFPGVSMVELEHVNVSWEAAL